MLIFHLPLLLLLSPAQYRLTRALNNSVSLHFVDGSALSSRPPEAPPNIRSLPVAILDRATPARHKSKQGDDAQATALTPTSSHSLTSPRLSQGHACLHGQRTWLGSTRPKGWRNGPLTLGIQLTARTTTARPVSLLQRNFPLLPDILKFRLNLTKVSSELKLYFKSSVMLFSNVHGKNPMGELRIAASPSLCPYSEISHLIKKTENKTDLTPFTLGFFSLSKTRLFIF